jgi:hypothetical protein
MDTAHLEKNSMIYVRARGLACSVAGWSSHRLHGEMELLHWLWL